MERNKEQDQQRFIQELKSLPLIMNWIAEIGARVEDVRTLYMDKQVIRDMEREAREKSGWRYNKLGDTITVSLVFADYSLHTQDFPLDEWQRQFSSSPSV